MMTSGWLAHRRQASTRREFLSKAGMGFGALGLAALHAAFAARDPSAAADRMTRFIHQAEESHSHLTRPR